MPKCVGLDVGTMWIVSATRDGKQVKFVKERDAYLDIKTSEFTTQMLDMTGVRYIKKNNDVYVVGNNAVEFANAFKRDLKRPLQRGLLSPQEEYAFPILAYVFKMLVGEGSQENVLCFSVPADPIDRDVDVTYHRNVVKTLLSRTGYQVIPVPEGLAVVYSELADTKFTGVGISFGAGMVNVACVYMSVPAFMFSLSRGGDWIDQSVARNVGVTSTKVCSTKERDFALGDMAEDPIRLGLNIYYRDLITYTLENVKQQLKRTQDIQFGDKVPVAISGGTSMVPGFMDLFKKTWDEVHMPLEISEIRHAKDTLYAVARGCLIVAEHKQSELDEKAKKKED